MKLYTYFRSSASYRVRIALNLKRVAYEPVFVHLRHGEQRRAAYLQSNPQGLVPALEVDGEVLTQSLAIIEYLDAIYPEPKLIPAAPLERARVSALAEIIACDLHPLNNVRVLRYLEQALGAGEAEVQGWYRHWVDVSFEPLETLLGRYAGRYSCGDAISLADVCLVPQVYNARRFGVDVARYPTLARIGGELEQHPAFLAASPERQPDAE